MTAKDTSGSRGNRKQADKSLRGERLKSDNALSRQFDEAESKTNTALSAGLRGARLGAAGPIDRR